MSNSLGIREALNENLVPWMHLKSGPPIKGWIRTIREALGMSGKQLAARIQVATPRISEMEKSETQGNITLKSMRRAAEAMECELVYAFVPKVGLDESLRTQAQRAAEVMVKSVGHSMRLEGHGLSPETEAKMISRKVDDFMRQPPRWLWDKI